MYKRSEFEPRRGTLCCVLGQDTASQPRGINGYQGI